MGVRNLLLSPNSSNQSSTAVYILQGAHIHHGTDAVAVLHRLERIVHATERLAVGDELVHLERALLVVGDQIAHLRATRDELERPGRDLLAGRRDPDDNALALALVARLESGAHDVNVARAVDRVVAH